MKIAVLDDYQDAARHMADWSRLSDHEVVFLHEVYAGVEDLAARIGDAQVVCIMRERSPIGADLLGRLPNLKLLVTAGMRNKAIDLDWCSANGIPVLGTQNSAQATPELAWGLIISLARNIPTENARMRDGSWITTLGTDLQGKTLGILGLGRLGRKMAQIARAFDMDVIAWSQNLTDDAAAEVGVRRVEKAALFAEADVVTVHYQMSERSRGLVGAAELAAMKSSAFLINTSRGPIVDTDALIAALESGQIAGAGIDVYDAEPLAPDHPIRQAPNTVLTPHLGYVTDGVYKAFYGQMVECIESWVAGSPVRVLA